MHTGAAHQLVELVVGLQAPQEAAELVVVPVLAQARLRAQDVPRARDQGVQEAAARLLTREERPAH